MCQTLTSVHESESTASSPSLASEMKLTWEVEEVGEAVTTEFEARLSCS